MNLGKLYESLGRHEGVKPQPYLDTKGLWTIGKGTCLETNPLTAAHWRYLLTNRLIKVELTEDGMDYLVSAKVDETIRALSNGLSNWLAIGDPRQNVLVEMGYQLAGYGCLAFPRMKAAVERNDWKEAAAQGLDSKWAQEDSPNRAKEMMDALQAGTYP